MIPPLDVKMMNNSTPILYLSSSMGSIYWDSLDVSYCDFVEPSSMNTLVSTFVDVTSTSHPSPLVDDAYVNLVSQADALSIYSSSCGLSSYHPPIFHFDEDINEAINTLDYPWYDMYHHAYFLPRQTHDQYVVESKELIHGEVD